MPRPRRASSAVALLLKVALEMFMLGAQADNVFSSFARPPLEPVREGVPLQHHLPLPLQHGLVHRRGGGLPERGQRRDGDMERVEAIQQFVSVAVLELFPIDAKRMAGDDMTDTLVALIKANPANYDALLALADTFLSSKCAWQPALTTMQQVVHAETLRCSLKLKWGVALFFCGYVPLESQIFKHEYYCGVAANILYELGPRAARRWPRWTRRASSRPRTCGCCACCASSTRTRRRKSSPRRAARASTTRTTTAPRT